MAPSPESGADFQSRWPQASQNSLGGISRLPQRPHLMAVSRPSRAVSQNLLSGIPVSVTAEHAHEHSGRVAAAGVGASDICAGHLARRSPAAPPGRDLLALTRAGRAARLAPCL